MLSRDNLWAPWRMPYIRAIDDKGGCFICDDLDNPSMDRENLVLWRSNLAVTVLNRYPYNNGHLLVAPRRHIAVLEEATRQELLEIMLLVRESQKALALVLAPDGFNVGMNFGRCGGAGLPGHLHVHVVPRWNGDTNFMSVCSDTKVVSQSLAELFKQLEQVCDQNNLPDLQDVSKNQNHA